MQEVLGVSVVHAIVGDQTHAGIDARLDRLAVPHTRSVALNVVAGLAAVALLVLPTVILVVPWLDRALADWPL